MRFKRGARQCDESVLVASRFSPGMQQSYALLVKLITGGVWWEAVQVADRERITPEAFEKITNFCTDEFELIEKEPKP